MTPSPKSNRFRGDLSPSDDDVALLAPWSAAGSLSPRDAHRVAAAAAVDPSLAAEICAARAEQAEAITLGEALGAPSVRPMLALFAAIDADAARSETLNVTSMTVERRRSRFAGVIADFKKIGVRR